MPEPEHSTVSLGDFQTQLKTMLDTLGGLNSTDKTQALQSLQHLVEKLGNNVPALQVFTDSNHQPPKEETSVTDKEDIPAVVSSSEGPVFHDLTNVTPQTVAEESAVNVESTSDYSCAIPESELLEVTNVCLTQERPKSNAKQKSQIRTSEPQKETANVCIVKIECGATGSGAVLCEGICERLLVAGPLCCNVCKGIFWRHEQYAKHSHLPKKSSEKRNPKGLYECPECGRTFPFRRHYLRHTEGHKNNNCSECGNLFTTRKQLAQHMLEVHKTKVTYKPYSCTKCSASFGKRKSLFVHLGKAHSEGKVVCVECGEYMEKNSESVLAHISSHNCKKGWSCEKCGEKFSRHQQYQVHMERHEKYKCLTCNMSYASLARIKQHKKQGHDTTGIDIKCDICGKKFTRLDQLKFHQLIHKGERPEVCVECGARFRTTKSLRRHLKTRIHNAKSEAVVDQAESTVVDTKPEISSTPSCMCEHCGEGFSTRTLLEQHLIRVHDEHREQCRYCDHKSSSRANLKRHESLHLNERRFICEECGSAFYTLASLKDHKTYVHSDERNYPCSKCGKAFKARSSLLRHERTHIDSRPYVCCCGQSYKRMSHLRRHAESAHKDMYEYPVNRPQRFRRDAGGCLVPMERDTPNSVTSVKSVDKTNQKNSVTTTTAPLPFATATVTIVNPVPSMDDSTAETAADTQTVFSSNGTPLTSEQRQQSFTVETHIIIPQDVNIEQFIALTPAAVETLLRDQTNNKIAVLSPSSSVNPVVDSALEHMSSSVTSTSDRPSTSLITVCHSEDAVTTSTTTSVTLPSLSASFPSLSPQSGETLPSLSSEYLNYVMPYLTK